MSGGIVYFYIFLQKGFPATEDEFKFFLGTLPNSEGLQLENEFKFHTRTLPINGIQNGANSTEECAPILRRDATINTKTSALPWETQLQTRTHPC